jgi:hypothetical protein
VGRLLDPRGSRDHPGRSASTRAGPAP